MKKHLFFLTLVLTLLSGSLNANSATSHHPEMPASFQYENTEGRMEEGTLFLVAGKKQFPLPVENDITSTKHGGGECGFMEVFVFIFVCPIYWLTH